MKILIVSMLLQPNSQIGAIRPTNFAKCLAESGHHVDVITMNNKSQKILSNKNLTVYNITNSKFVTFLLNYFIHKITVSRKAEKIKEKKQKKISIFKGVRTHILELIRSTNWKKRGLKHFVKTAKKNQYDIIFSSYGPMGSYLLGRALYKKGFAKYWISDLRDLMIDEIWPTWINRFFGNFHYQMLKEANAITVVSRGAANILINQYCVNDAHRKKINIITNGYEKDYHFYNKNSVADNILRICYTGALYSGQRDMSLLFEAISNLLKTKAINPNKIQIHYAGSESKQLLLQANPYYVDQLIKDHGIVSHNDALQIQSSSDIMVVLSWNTDKEQGILTGKFFEYLSVNKPIISITSGNLPDAELTMLIRNMKLGLACEYVTKKKDIKLLEDYILNCYKSKENGRPMKFESIKKKVEEYRYDNLTKKLESLFRKLNSNFK